MTTRKPRFANHEARSAASKSVAAILADWLGGKPGTTVSVSNESFFDGVIVQVERRTGDRKEWRLPMPPPDRTSREGRSRWMEALGEIYEWASIPDAREVAFLPDGVE